MSNLEDLEHEPEDLNPEEELAAQDDDSKKDSSKERSSRLPVDKNILLGAAAALIVVVGGGAYFMKSYQARNTQAEAPFVPPSSQQATANPAGPSADGVQPGADVPAWGAPSAAPASEAAANSNSQDFMPSAIPPMGEGADAPVSAMPQIVNEMPPSSAPLMNAGDASPPTSIDAGLPGMPAPDAAIMPSPSMSGDVPQFPPQDAAATAETNSAPAPVARGESTPVAAADQANAGGAGINTAGIMPPSSEMGAPVPAAAQAEIERLQKKIDDLEKTIVQLQQTAVVKEDAAEKAAMQERASAAPSSKSRRAKVQRHVPAVKWVLKAAKPGVAWVARSGSDDLQMVEAGDALSGIGKVVSVTQDLYGVWVVKGTKGRISQQ